VLPTTRPTQARANPPENELVALGEHLFKTAKNYRDQKLGMMDRWRTYRSWYLNAGGTWEHAGASRSMTYVNLIYEKIEKITADLTEGRPSFLYTPHTISDIPVTDLLNQAVPFIWAAHNMSTKYFHTVKATNLYGTWYWKVIHDPRDGKVGSVEKIVEIPPWHGFPAPHSLDFESCPWFIETRVRTVGEIENDYGVKVDPEIGTANDLFPEISEDLKQYHPFSHVAGPEYNAATGDPNTGLTGETGPLVQGIPDTFLGSSGARAGLVIQKEFWVRDGTTDAQFWWDERDGSAPPELKKTFTRKYPGGRVISWANGRLLYDMPNPYKHGRFPYAKFTDISVPDFWYGLGEVEPLINLQLLHDDTHEIIKQIHLFTALGRLIVDEDTGLGEDSMGNEPGEIWFVKPGTSDRLKWLQGSSPPAELYTYLSTLERSADLVTGSHDVTRGINPTGVTAGRALSTLQNAASIRIRARLNDIEPGLIDTGRLLAAIIQQFWPDELAVRIAGGEAVGAIPEDAKTFKKFRLDPVDREASFNLEVSATANIDQIREQEFQKLLLLFQAGMITPEALIEGSNLTGKDKILAELPLLAARSGLPPEGENPPSGTQQIAQGVQ
jgi:hypothetical protein